MTGYSKLNVITRLTGGFLVLLIITTSVSVYAIVKLNEFNKASTHMLDMGDRMTGYKERLSNALLSQVLYEKKYVISTDNTLYNHFLATSEDFVRYLDEAISMADTPVVKEMLANIKNQHIEYKTLFEEEARHLRLHKTYRTGWYKAEKEKTVENMLEELNNLELYVEEDIKNRIKGLTEAGARALKTAVAMAIFSLIFGIILAAGITRGITKPLAIMKRKTREISRGIFESSLNLSSPPEIGELARAFNLMCDRLGEMDRMKSDFFSLMAHELRTPLSSIKAGITLLEKNEGCLEEQRKERVLAILSEECNRLIGLVNSLLDLSKMEAGMVSFDLAPGTMRPLIEKAIAEIEPLASVKKISVEFNTTGQSPFVIMDNERILQVLRNLLGNAIKFTPEGGRITVSSRPAEGGLEVFVTDSGSGISEEDCAVIFDKYKQATTEVHARIRGTGLGLAIAKHVVDAHGGRIWVESKQEKGSTFAFFLPA
ncbi:MAG: Alkaline phosphatase synthesis sensor protein PhoR [Syntrophorhabdus sp. PtaU1.Bin058]|nr:MAG: Alkaline phosphatase synthesis sensor protein PhoR [Syntrophorhabdus sp. PtaU1.Bin058]